MIRVQIDEGIYVASLFRRKIVTEQPPEHQLARTLSWPHLVAMGVGGIVGTGILTLIGVGAGLAGPAVILSFVIAGGICACAALAYAEMATMIPASGSAYTYSYVVLGELIAWVIGWSLILEYSLVVSTVAVGWSGYAAPLLRGAFGFPEALTLSPELGGILNVPAIVIIAVVAGVLSFGTRESATLNAVLVGVKMIALTVRRDLDRGGGDQEPRPRPGDRHPRIDGRVHRDLHPRRGRSRRRSVLHAVRGLGRAARADPARDRAAGVRDLPGRVGGHRVADRAARLFVRTEPDLLHDGA
jgi:hypothetical protein